MNNDIMRKKILFVSIVVSVFFVSWDFFILKPMKQKMLEQQKTIEQLNVENKNLKENPVNNEVVEQENTTQIEEKTVNFENDFIKGSISNKGMKFAYIELKKYTEEINSEKKIQLLSDDYFVNFGWISDYKIELPNSETIWNIEENTDNKIVFSYVNNIGVKFYTTIILDDKYMFDIGQKVENLSNKTIFLKSYTEIQKKHISGDKYDLNRYLLTGVFNKGFEDVKIQKLKKRNYEFTNTKWFALSNNYWATSIIANNNNVKTNFLQNGDFIKAQSISNENITVKSNGKYSIKYNLFAGAKDLKILDEYSKEKSIVLFDRIVDFGSLYILTKPMYLLLNLFNKFTKNFGIAILLLTILVKLILYPSTKKSFISMAKMRQIQPEMMRLQERYKNDKLTFSLKMQELYKNNNISPFSGILILFIQIPIFFALYKVFTVTIEMRQAPFFGYLKDLSVMDPTSIFNLFGLLPFQVKAGLGLLPCLMALTMWMQQKMNDKMNNSTNTQQSGEFAKSMTSSMKWMPIIMLVMFSSLPSGLILYWVYNNIITMIQQYLINRKISKMPTKM